jgi:hypothetical protein
MKHLQLINSVLFTLIILACFTSCTKDDVTPDSNYTAITVKLKSTLSEYDKVYLDIEDVQLRISENANTWLSLNAINRGTHNFCDLIEGAELLLVDDFEIESTFIYEIRLVLGDNNFIDLNNSLYSLDTTNLGDAMPSNILRTELIKNRFYDVTINIDIDNSVSFNEDENMRVLNPELYTEIRQTQY